MTDRDARGRFLTGNTAASRGGRARAARLSPQRRAEIARLGFEAFVVKRFAGDRSAAVAWLSSLGMWAVEQTAYADDPNIYKPDVYPHPGPCPGDTND